MATQIAKQLGSAGEQIGGEAGGEIGQELGQIAQWLLEPLNQWKLKMLVSIVAIPLLVLILNVQIFLVKLVGLKIPKLLPDMPWWEVMITCILDLMIVLAILIALSPALILISVGCSIPVLNWFAC